MGNPVYKIEEEVVESQPEAEQQEDTSEEE
jgi:hypothetical protein